MRIKKSLFKKVLKAKPKVLYSLETDTDIYNEESFDFISINIGDIKISMDIEMFSNGYLEYNELGYYNWKGKIDTLNIYETKIIKKGRTYSLKLSKYQRKLLKKRLISLVEFVW